MKRLYCDIRVGRFRFDFVTSCTINSSRETFTDTAVLELPNRIKERQTGNLRNITDYIKINDEVTISLGYFPNLTERFRGYVSEIVPDSPMRIKCEDEAFKLKQVSVGPYSAQNTTISALIGALYDGETQITDANIGDIRIEQNATLANVLDDLKRRFGVRSYFRAGVLYIFSEIESEGDTVSLGFQQNIIEHSLQFQEETALKVVSHGVSVQDDGTKIERYAYYKDAFTAGAPSDIVTVSDNPGGTLNTFSWPGLSQAALDKLIEKRLPRLYWTGIKGDLTTFGEPVIAHGDNVMLADEVYEERQGTYKVKAVRTDFGMNGYRQTVELDVKVA